MKKRGKFIVFEGVGGSGKSNQAKLAKEYLVKRGEKAIYTREPGGLEEGEQIRELIFKLRTKKLINADHQMAFFFASRHLWLNGIVIPALKRGIHVSSDRSYPTTAAYQGYGEGGDLELIRKISEAVMGDYKPDAIVLLDISAQTAKKRNNQPEDPFDAEPLAYFEKLVLGYRKMAKENWSGVPWFMVDGKGSIRDVSRSVRGILDQIVFGGKTR